MKQIKDLEQQFTIETPKLHEIVAKFQSELEKGKFPGPPSEVLLVDNP